METSRISCGTCVGACCRRNTALPLSPWEVLQLKAAGTDMRRMSPIETEGQDLPPGRSFYTLLSDCGNLDPETAECRDYANRPTVCREFEEGSFGCRQMRAQRLGAILLPLPTVREA